METFIENWSAQFDDSKYPTAYYFYYLKKVEEANSNAQLAQAIVALLHWREEKIIKNSAGDIEINGTMFSRGESDPATSQFQTQVDFLRSDLFFNWAQTIRNQTSFQAGELRSLQDRIAQQWKLTDCVIPAFILHVLAPRIYPIYDQNSERAKKVLMAQNLPSISELVDSESYHGYKSFYDQVVKEFNERESITLNEYKQISEALWCFGKWVGKHNIRTNKVHEAKKVIPDSAFKHHVIELVDSGMMELQAMKRAAHQFNIELKSSHYKYPGSFVSHWRNQLT